ncbi:MAG: hypothetical protein QM698_07305 [Micropepsaceae bacterium]
MLRVYCDTAAGFRLSLRRAPSAKRHGLSPWLADEGDEYVAHRACIRHVLYALDALRRGLNDTGRRRDFPRIEFQRRAFRTRQENPCHPIASF